MPERIILNSGLNIVWKVRNNEITQIIFIFRESDLEVVLILKEKWISVSANNWLQILEKLL